MKNVLVLGANGQIAQWVVKMLSNQNDIKMTLLIRNPKKIRGEEPKNAQIVIGDVCDKALMQKITADQDIVYVNLAGKVDEQMKVIVEAMKKNHIKRIINISSIGVYDEVPGPFGEWNNRELVNYLPPYKRAADILEHSGLDYTIIRPAWLTNHDEVNYELTQKGQPFKGTEVSRKSIAALVVELINKPEEMLGASVGVNKPNTDGSKPAFM